MCSVGMGQENLKQRLTIHTFNLFQGDRGAQARTLAQSPLGQPDYIPVVVIGGRQQNKKKIKKQTA
jgi:hypothetical protein